MSKLMKVQKHVPQVEICRRCTNQQHLLPLNKRRFIMNKSNVGVED